MSLLPAYSETALVLSYQALKNHYAILRLQSKTLAFNALPGHRIKIALADQTQIVACIMNQFITEDIVEILVIEPATIAAEFFITSTEIQWQGFYGESFDCTLYAQRHQNIIVVAEDIACAATVFFAKRWRELKPNYSLLILLGFSSKSPITIKPSELLVDHMPNGVIACLPLLDDWGIPSRIASAVQEVGCYAGTANELLDHYLQKANLAQPRVIRFQ